MADTTVVRDIMTKNIVMIDHDKTALEAAQDYDRERHKLTVCCQR